MHSVAATGRAEAAPLVSFFCDNTDAPNWGCRGTSLALRDCIDGAERHVSSFPRAIAVRTVARIPPWRLPSRATQFADRLAGRANTAVASSMLPLVRHLDAIGEDFDRSARRLEAVARSNELWADVLETIRRSTAVVINGEGSMIFTTPPRRDLLFQMTIARVAQRFGVPVHYVNAVISPCPQKGENRGTIDACMAVLASCASVIVRDPVSAEYARSLGLPPQKVRCVPDALFTWSTFEQALARPSVFAELESFPERGTIFSERTRLPERYIALSGASVPPGTDRGAWIERFVELVGRIEGEFGLPIVLVAPDEGDAFLAAVGVRTHKPVVGPTTPILRGCGLLAHADAYVSGRYHPSIMAALGGTPLVHFTSNSHKLEGLRELLHEDLDPLPGVDQPDFIDTISKGLDAALSSAGTRDSRQARALALGQQATEAYTALLDG